MTKKIVTAIVLSVSLALASADTVTHFGDGIGSDVPSLLDQVGIGSGNSGSETTATSFIVPGASGNTTLTFEFVRDTGGFLFDFGVYPISATLGIDPVSDKEAFATAAVGAATQIFDDRLVNPVATTSISLPAGEEVGFFIVPNNTIANFLADPGAFYPPSVLDSLLRAPHFSVSDANPGEYDQMLSFVGNGVTLFTFEDLTRIGASDEDFTDIAFTIDAELEPVEPPINGVPDGGVGALGLGFAMTMVAFLKRRVQR